MYVSIWNWSTAQYFQNENYGHSREPKLSFSAPNQRKHENNNELNRADVRKLIVKLRKSIVWWLLMLLTSMTPKEKNSICTVDNQTDS